MIRNIIVVSLCILICFNIDVIASDDDYDLIILTPTEFLSDLQLLAEHKEQYGIVTKIVTFDDIYDGVYFPVIGRDNAEKVKYFIKNAKESWNISYVMFIGDEPVRYLHTRIPATPPFISDLYYADIFDENGGFCSWDSDGDDKFGELTYGRMIDFMDLYPDVYVGRILCQTSLEIEYVVNQIIDYETNEKSGFNNLILCGGNTHPTILDIIYGKSFGGYIVNEGEFKGDKVAEVMDGFNPIKLYASSFSLTKKNINNAINEGAGFILFSGHGAPNAWRTYSPIRIPMPFLFGYTSFDTKHIDNGNKLPIAIFNACSCGDFSNGTPIAWEMVKNGGSIASFAYTTESLSMPSSLCTETLSGYVTVNIFKTYSNGNNILGSVIAETLKNYLNNAINKYRFSNETSYEYMGCWILFGDPSLKIGGYE